MIEAPATSGRFVREAPFPPPHVRSLVHDCVQVSMKDLRPVESRWALVVTNTIKLAGVIVALNEIFTHNELRPGALAIAALMMTGAQSFETFFGAFFGGRK